MKSDGSKEPRATRHLFSLEDMECLLQAVYATEEIPG